MPSRQLLDQPNSSSIMGSKIRENAVALRQRSGSKSSVPNPFLEECCNSEKDYDDDEESEFDPYGEDRRCCRFWNLYYMKRSIKILIPTWWPVGQISVYFIAVICLCVRRTANEEAIPFEGYLIYLGFTFICCLTWLILRIFWIYFVSYRVLSENRYVIAMNSVLDPNLVYLFSTITVLLCWAYIPVIYNWDERLGLSALSSGSESVTDLKVLFRINLFLVLWTARGLVLTVLTFHFLTGFLMAFNANLVRYLTLAGTIRRLNAGWVRLTPLISNSMREKRYRSTVFKRRKTLSRIVRSSTSLGSKKSGKLGRETFEAKSTKSIYGAFQVDISGNHVPKIFSHKNIGKTTTNSLKNLVCIQYCRQNLAVIFVGGERVELTRKDIAREAAMELFDEIIQFRDFLAPTGGEEERNCLATKFTVILRDEGSLEFSQFDIKASDSSSKTSLRLNRTFSRHGSIISAAADGSLNPSTLSSLPSEDIVVVAPKETESMSSEKIGSNLQLPTIIEGSDSIITKYSDSFLTNEDHKILSETAHGMSKALDSDDTFGIPEDTSSDGAESKLSIDEDSESKSRFSAYKVTTDMLFNPWDKSPLWKDVPRANSIVSQAFSDEEMEKTRDFVVIDDPAHGEPSDGEKRQDGRGSRKGSIRKKKKGEKEEEPQEKVKIKSNQYLSRDFLKLFLEDQIDVFMKNADRSGRQRISRSNFVNVVVEMYQLRKQLCELVASQESMRHIVSRMMAVFLGFISVLIFLIILGVPEDTVILSGATVVSACTVVLSFLYTGFVQAIIFICFLNPYNVGDRVRIDNQIHIVKRIHTYYTEFVTMEGKPETFSHSFLFTKSLMNESRNKNASLEIVLIVHFLTPQSKYEHLHYQVEQFIQTHPEFVKDSFTCLLGDVVIGHYIKFTYWLSTVEGWGQWKTVFATRAKLMEFINSQCELLGIDYKLPAIPVELRLTY